jgi:hypothetical protein
MAELSDGSGTRIVLDDNGRAHSLRREQTEIRFERAPVRIRRDDNADDQLDDTQVAGRFGLVRRDSDYFLFRLDDPERREVRTSARLALTFAFDPSLPGDPGPLPDPLITWECAKGDLITQPASSTNRTCPLDGLPLTRA